MSVKPRYIPDDLVEHTVELYRNFGIDVVTRCDDRGNPLELNVPYDQGQGQMRGYRISRDGSDIKARLLARKSYPCSMTRKEKQELQRLFRKIDRLGPTPDVPLPCTCARKGG